MRLIDADELKINLYHNKKVVLNDDLVNCIDDTETAYDVDKVVEQLEDRSKEYNSGVRLRGKPEEIITNEAIEIVKGGGRD